MLDAEQCFMFHIRAACLAQHPAGTGNYSNNKKEKGLKSQRDVFTTSDLFCIKMNSVLEIFIMSAALNIIQTRCVFLLPEVFKMLNVLLHLFNLSSIDSVNTSRVAFGRCLTANTVKYFTKMILFIAVILVFSTALSYILLVNQVVSFPLRLFLLWRTAASSQLVQRGLTFFFFFITFFLEDAARQRVRYQTTSITCGM